MLNAISKIQKSIFGRLLFIFFITATSIFLVLAFSFNLAVHDGDDRRSKFIRIFNHHANYLVQDIGSPPDLDKAKKITDSLHIQLMISGPNLLWKSSNDIANPSDIQQHHPALSSGKINADKNNTKVSTARHHRNHFFIIQKGDYSYYLTGLRPFIKKEDRIWLWIALSICAAILYLSYRAVKWLFAPLNLIKKGAQRIEQGDTSYRIETQRSDEIGEITYAVNSMATELKNMLEAKRQLLLAISHELRTPLTRAKVGLEFISNEKVKNSLKEDLNEIDNLINELLEAERLNEKHHALQITSIDFNSLIKTVIEETPDPNHLISSALSNTKPMIQGDALRLKLLIKNLIGNGLKYGNDKPLNITVTESDDTLEVIILDQGDGIEETHLPHITEPFYRADNARQRQTGGYGLGLYLCRLITEAHKGKLTINSTINIGTTITINLPLN